MPSAREGTLGPMHAPQKRPVNLSVSAAILAAAREARVNLSALLERALAGEVARLKFQETPFGHTFDVMTDNVVHAAIFVCLGIGQYRQHPDGHYGKLSALLLGGVACAAAALYWVFLREPQALRATPPRTTGGKLRAGLLRGYEAVMNRDFAYLLFALAVIGRLSWFLWGAAFGTYVFAASLLWVYRWREPA